MIIQRLEIVGLYGYIDKKIDFNSDITVLVGINGSGKTSILNIISWLIKPSIADLCVTEFSEIRLKFIHNNKISEIECKHEGKMFTYSLVVENEEKYHPLTVPISVAPKDLTNDDNKKNEKRNDYADLNPDKKERRTWDFITTHLTSPTIIGLDRNLNSNAVPNEAYETEIKLGAFSRKYNKVTTIETLTPIEKAKEIINSEYRRKSNKIFNLTQNLKNQLMLSAFEGNLSAEALNAGIRYKIQLHQIEKVENKVISYFDKYEKKNFSSDYTVIIKKYFNDIKAITRLFKDDPEEPINKALYGLNSSQFVKIKNLLKQFERFEENSAKEFLVIKHFIDTLNYFFKDSYKCLVFKEDSYEIYYNILDKEKKVVPDFKNIRFLSSGEQQLLILFAALAFNSKDGRIFIIDEPDLFLHVRWQEDFLDYFEKIGPLTQKNQIIITTHSPIIANRRKEKVVVLYPFNQ